MGGAAMGPWMDWMNADPIGAARANAKVTTLVRRLALEARCPEITFRLPWETDSGMWEVSTPDGVTPYEDPEVMMKELEARYPV
jgi:hypothetical protein